MSDLTLGLDIVGRDQGAGALVSGLLKSFLSFGSGPSLAGIGGMTAALTGFGAILDLSVQKAAPFQASMLKVQALAGLTKSQTDSMGKSILQMATVVGQSPQQLAEGLYYVASAGFRGADALHILQLSAEAAATGHFDTKVAADALTSAINAFGLSGKDATMVMDEMTATVSAGKMEWSNYANVVGKLSVISKASGLSFAEANAALATLTNSGYSAHLAGTSLGNLFTQLELKTDSLAKNARKLGVSFDEQKFKSMSLGQQIAYLTAITHGNQSELLKLMNNNSTALKTFDALSGSMSQYNANLQTIGHSQGMTAQAFQITQQGFSQSVNRLNAALDVLLISIGEKFLPILTQIVNDITPVVAGLASWIATTTFLDTALGALSGAMATVDNAAYWLGVSFGRSLAFETHELGIEMFSTSQIAGTKLAPALQFSSQAAQAAKPVYQNLSDTVGYTLSGSYAKAGDSARAAAVDFGKMAVAAAQASVTITEKLIGGFASGKLNVGGVVSGVVSGISGKLGGLGALGDIFSGLLDKLKPVLNWLSSTFGPTITTVAGVFAQAWQRMAEALQPFVTFFQQHILPVWQEWGSRLVQQLQSLWSTVVSVYTQAYNDLKPTIMNFLAWLNGEVPGAPNFGQGGLAKQFEDLIPHIQKFGDALINNVIPLFGAVLRASLPFFEFLVKLGVFLAETMIPTFLNLFKTITGHQVDITSLGQWFDDAGKRVQGAANNITNFLGGLQNLGNWINTHGVVFLMELHDEFQSVQLQISATWADLQNFGGWISSSFGGLAMSFAGFVNQYLAAPLNGIQGIIDGLLRGLAQVASAIPGMPQVGGQAGGSVRGYASGGIVGSSGLALVGEHGPELVNLPAGSRVYPSGTGPAAGGITIGTINVVVPGGNARQIADEIKRELANVLRTQANLVTITSGGQRR